MGKLSENIVGKANILTRKGNRFKIGLLMSGQAGTVVGHWKRPLANWGLAKKSWKKERNFILSV